MRPSTIAGLDSLDWTGGLDWWNGRNRPQNSFPDQFYWCALIRICTHVQMHVRTGRLGVRVTCSRILILCDPYRLPFLAMAVAGTSKERPISIDSSPGSASVSPVKPVARAHSLAKCR